MLLIYALASCVVLAVGVLWLVLVWLREPPGHAAMRNAIESTIQTLSEPSAR